MTVCKLFWSSSEQQRAAASSSLCSGTLPTAPCPQTRARAGSGQALVLGRDGSREQQERGRGGVFSKARSQPKHRFKARFIARQGNNTANTNREQPPQQTTALSYLEALFQLI